MVRTKKVAAAVAAGALAATLAAGAPAAQAAPAPQLPMPQVYAGQQIGNSSASDYRLGIYPTGGYTPYVSLKIDGTYTVGGRYSASYFRVELSGKSWRQKWSGGKYGACHPTPAGRLVKPPTDVAKVTYKTYRDRGC